MLSAPAKQPASAINRISSSRYNTLPRCRGSSTVLKKSRTVPEALSMTPSAKEGSYESQSLPGRNPKSATVQAIALEGTRGPLWNSGHRDRFGYLPWSRRQSWALSRPGRVGRRITGRERLVRRLILPFPRPARFVAHMLRSRRPEVTVATLRFPRLLIAEGNKPAGGWRVAGLSGTGLAHSTQRRLGLDQNRRLV